MFEKGPHPMMIDYNVSNHWDPEDPEWLKSLVSSLDRRHGRGTTLPLTVIVAEIADWVALASGVDSWIPQPGRASLRGDLGQSVEGLGPSLRRQINASLQAFDTAFTSLITEPKATLRQPPGTRTDPAWGAVSSTASELLAALATDGAVKTSWDDLVAKALDRTVADGSYQPIAELLFAQLQQRGHDAESVFGELVSIVAFGHEPHDAMLGAKDTPLDARLDRARAFVSTPGSEEPTVVWLGYKGRIHQNIEAGRVCFYDAHWVVPNASPGRPEFAYKNELWEVVRGGYTFRVAEMVGEESDVDTVVRVDLGNTTVARAVDRATAMVDVILSVSIHRVGGIRPRLAQFELLRSGRTVGGGHMALHEAGFPNDTYGAEITTEAVEQHGPRVAEALAREELPLFLRAALEVQTAAERPFSRDMALRSPSEADVSSVVPLSDRVVQHVAAHAAMSPDELFEVLGQQWAHARWLSDLRRAAGMCMLGGSSQSELRDELVSKWMSNRLDQPWLLLLDDRTKDLLSLCRVEHERAWIARMFSSISSHAVYRALIEEYESEGKILDARRRRVRNALTHGNPTSFAAAQSVRDYASFTSGAALYLAIESYVDGTPPAAALAERTDEFLALDGGQSPATYWRERVANGDWLDRR